MTDGSAEVSKEDAIASLGDAAARFVVVSWDKAAKEAKTAAKEDKKG